MRGENVAGMSRANDPGESARAGPSRGARYVVLHVVGLSVDGRVRATVESGAWGTLEEAIAHSVRLEESRRSRKRAKLAEFSVGVEGNAASATNAVWELPLETKVWHVERPPGLPRSKEDGEFMVATVASVQPHFPMKILDAVPAVRDLPRSAATDPSAPVVDQFAQIDKGVPFVEAKIFGQKILDPFNLRPCVSTATFRTLVTRAIGKYLAEEREPFPVLPKQDAQIQIANGTQGMQCHVLAIRALGHGTTDFSISVDEMGRVYVRCEAANPLPVDPSLGRPFELVCQFPTLIDLHTCRCVYQRDVLYVIAYPRLPKSRSLRLSTMGAPQVKKAEANTAAQPAVFAKESPTNGANERNAADIPARVPQVAQVAGQAPEKNPTEDEEPEETLAQLISRRDEPPGQ